ncbi:MAG: ABC transporter ATP-binding protein [Tenericutes bacterium HGW-Tenericutes-1]|nr:MAG: ABC transporter ATP-binding protein [Tenericutes bacterium HGW-Tenericutes-1]
MTVSVVISMNILKISNLMKTFTGNLLFERVSLEVNSGEKIALIGQNGTGKSTLVKMILGEIIPDSGEIFLNRSATIGYLSQSVLEDENKTMIDEIMTVYERLIQLENDLDSISHLLKTDHSEGMLKRYTIIEEEFSRLGGYEYHYNVDMILTKFGFTKAEYDRQIKTFSGGEKTRIAFAKLLMKKPDLLILDEPTNHMDIEIIEWLEEYLKKYPGAILCITHDKYFINKIAEKIYEIDQQTVSVYYGNFDQYEIEKVKRYELLLKQYNRQAKEIEHLQSFVDRFRYKATKAKSAQDRIKKINRIERIDKPTTGHANVRFQFKSKRPTEAVILTTKDLNIGYDNILQGPINFEMRGYEKVGVIGPNGIGKTTFIKTILDTLPPISGEVLFHKQLKIGYFDQNLQGLDESITVLNTVHNRYPVKTLGEVRSLLARFLFVEEDVFKSVSVLSGGERVRLTLLMMMLEEPELLILDEPTNHLDIETKNIVEDVFESYEGPIIFISHDRYFINKVASKIVDFRSNGFEVYEGNYDDYKIIKAEELLSKPTIKPTKIKQVNTAAIIKKIETQIDNLHIEKEQLKQSLYLDTIYNDQIKFNKAMERINQIDQEIDELFLKIDEMTVQSVD